MCDKWRPISTAPEIVQQSRGRLGQHRGQVLTLPNGRHVVVWHIQGGSLPLLWFVLPSPPTGKEGT